jgi:lysophospholipase L1-like esterase
MARGTRVGAGMPVWRRVAAVGAAGAATLALVAVQATDARAGVVVSLGDSYSSGEGSGNYDSETDRAANGCHRTRNAWPRLIGVAKEHHLACSGARMKHLQRGKTLLGADREGQLIRMVGIGAGTQIDTVLITIGGNDMDFAGKIRACRIGDCLRNRKKLDGELAKLRSDLAKAYDRVATAAGTGARVVVVGYPDVVPGPRESFHGCGWITDAEKPRLQHLQRALDRALRLAAGDVGVDFVSIRDALDGRELCTRKSWMVPITARFRDWLGHPEQGHPNADGQVAIAVEVGSYLKRTSKSCAPASTVGAIVDDSGSMADNDPAGIRRSALELLITKPSGQGRELGAVEFGTNAAPLFAAGPVASQQGAMLAALSALADDGADGEADTDYNAAFLASRTSQPDAQARIFLTDGEHNEGEYDEGHVGGPRTYVVGLNIGPAGQGDEAAELLGRIAADTGGRYFPLRLSAGDDTDVQVARLQPTLNEIDALLACQQLQGQTSQSFSRTGQVGGNVGGRFVKRRALEIVFSWGTAGADFDLKSAAARNRRGRTIANLNGRGRIGKSRKRHKRLKVDVVEGQAFETVTVQRPVGGRRLALRLKAVQLSAPTTVSVQVRAVAPGAAAPGAVQVGGSQPVAAPAPAQQPPPAAPRKVLTVDNRVTNGMGMREDTSPVRLTTKPWKLCTSRGCNIDGTERWSGGTYDAAICQTQGERTTNGHDTNPSDDANPLLFESTRYYGVRLQDGTFGFVSEVWIHAADRGGLGLPPC